MKSQDDFAAVGYAISKTKKDLKHTSTAIINDLTE